MSKRIKYILIGLVILGLLSFFLYQIPRVQNAINWRFEKYSIYVKNIINPVGPVPTALPVTPRPGTSTPIPAIQSTATPANPSIPTGTSASLPPQVILDAPAWEQQTPNNCGPATLSMALHMYGWEGDQKDIAKQIKPVVADRNVNPEEMAYYVRNNAGWLNIQYRVAGNVQLLKKLIAARYPIMIEGTTSLDPNDALGPNDDLWAAHYLLLTGYDDATQSFTAQDSYHGANQTVTYEKLEEEWKPFNYLYIVLYLPQEEAEIKSILGSDFDEAQNRQHALTLAQEATKADPNDAFAWFNLGSNLVYFERYDEAAQAYDKSRMLPLPLRMFRYQFGPFIAYFQSNRNDDLLVLTDYARGVTDMSEETWLWYGWALYRKNDFKGALAAWNKAISINDSSYVDARRAIAFLNQTP
jgi:tetratricopeptide (TPR) repeat protein